MHARHPTTTQRQLVFVRRLSHTHGVVSLRRYPCIERRPQWDDYGEIIRPEDYMVEDPREAEVKAAEAAAASAVAAAQAAAKTPQEVPTKCISREIRLHVSWCWAL